MSSELSESAVVSVDDKIKVYWSKTDEAEQDGVFRVIKIKKCDKIKEGSWFSYTLQNVDNEGDVRKTRLLNLKYKLKGNRKRKIENLAIEELMTRKLPDYSLILAPMVGKYLFYVG